MAYLHVRATSGFVLGEREELIIPCKIEEVDMLHNVIYIIVNKGDEFEDNEEIVLEMINEYEEDRNVFYMDKGKLNGKEQECFIFVLSNDIEENVLKKLFKKESFDSVYLAYITIPMNDFEKELLVSSIEPNGFNCSDTEYFLWYLTNICTEMYPLSDSYLCDVYELYRKFQEKKIELANILMKRIDDEMKQLELK